MGTRSNPQLDSFLARLSSDQAFADFVASDPEGAAVAGGLSDEDAAHLVAAVARTNRSRENIERVQWARAEVEANGVNAFQSASTEDLIHLGRAAHATARLCADRSDEVLRLWGDVEEWRDRIAALRQANASWPAIAAAQLSSRPRPNDPARQSEVTLALDAFAELAVIASA